MSQSAEAKASNEISNGVKALNGNSKSKYNIPKANGTHELIKNNTNINDKDQVKITDTITSNKNNLKLNGAATKKVNTTDFNNSNNKDATNDTQTKSVSDMKSSNVDVKNDDKKNGSAVNGACKTKKYSATENGTSEQHLIPNRGISPAVRVPGSIPKRRQDLLHTCSWGYKDTVISLRHGKCSVSSDRYGFKEAKGTEALLNYIKETFGVDPYSNDFFTKKPLSPLPEPVIKKEFVTEIEKHNFSFSIDTEDRRYRSHGQKSIEIYHLQTGIPYQRYVDFVVWPSCHEDVVRLVEMANVHNVVLIPFGGGTSVTGGVTCNPEEKRMIVSLDTSQMDQMLWLDKTNMLARFQAGIVGQDLDRILEEKGFMSGHEPDSNEFSSLGGWVATRASGMKKNKYGNIEDIVTNIQFVTSNGTYEKNNQAQRISCGPDFNHLVLGSEGTLGIVTEVTIKVRPLPEVKDYNSYVFPDFSSGVKFMQEVTKKRWQPAALRLIDNDQYRLGKVLKEPPEGYIANFIEDLKMFYLGRIKGIDENKMAVSIMVFEGDYAEVQEQQRNIASVAACYGGVEAGPSNGKRGYLLTYLVTYLREAMMANYVFGDSFETSVSWDRCELLVNNVRRANKKKAKELGVKYSLTVSRISQVYDSGVCAYFYILFNFKDVADPEDVCKQMAATTLETIESSGGSLSHHHGVGKTKSSFYPNQASEMAVDIFKSIKKQLDPKDIFAAGNIIPH